MFLEESTYASDRTYQRDVTRGQQHRVIPAYEIPPAPPGDFYWQQNSCGIHNSSSKYCKFAHNSTPKIRCPISAVKSVAICETAAIIAALSAICFRQNKSLAKGLVWELFPIQEKEHFRKYLLHHLFLGAQHILQIHVNNKGSACADAHY